MIEFLTLLGKLVVIVVVGVMALSGIIITAQNGYRTYQAWKEAKE